MKITEIAEVLGRSKGAVSAKASELGLTRKGLVGSFPKYLIPLLEMKKEIDAQSVASEDLIIKEVDAND